MHRSGCGFIGMPALLFLFSALMGCSAILGFFGICWLQEGLQRKPGTGIAKVERLSPRLWGASATFVAAEFAAAGAAAGVAFARRSDRWTRRAGWTAWFGAASSVGLALAGAMLIWEVPVGRGIDSKIYEDFARTIAWGATVIAPSVVAIVGAIVGTALRAAGRSPAA